MGGNSRAIDPATGQVKMWKDREAYAEAVDLDIFPRKTIQRNIIDALMVINDLYLEHYKTPLWPDFDIVKSGQAFNGSTELFFSNEIPTEKFKAIKPKIGDFDVTVPFETKSNLWTLLSTLEGKQVTNTVWYIGSNKTTDSSVGYQINSVLDLTIDGNTVFFQIDWEFSDYKDGKPTVWAKFSKSSSWLDLEVGIKGVFHKYLLRALARDLNPIKNAVLLTPKSPIGEGAKVKIATSSPSDGIVQTLTFSILHGLRIKTEIQEIDGKIFLVDGKIACKEIKPENSKYMNEPDKIFQILFGANPTDGEMQLFGSFTGLLHLMERYNVNPVPVFEEFVEIVWGKINGGILSPRGQALYRLDWEKDRFDKLLSIHEFHKILPKTVNIKIEHILDLYYGENGELYK